jgi:hypothetical protein
VNSRSTSPATDSAIGSTLRALFAPWSFARDSPRIAAPVWVAIAGLQIALAAALSVLLSTWTYLIGKGLIMTPREMDMGMDDLPADSIRQVAASFVTSFAVWIALLVLTVAICVAVADLIYADDRRGFQIAVRRTAVLTIWFVVWAAIVLAINSVRHDELTRPAAAIRAYAQLNQHWFSGSSAFGPGPIEREPLVARGRLRWLAVIFSLIWSVALPLPSGRRRVGRPALVLIALGVSLIAWWSVWRLLPWTVLETWAG